MITSKLHHEIVVHFIAFDILIFNRNKLKDQKKYNFTATRINNIGGSLLSYAGEYFPYDKNLLDYDIFYGVSSYYF